MRRLSLMPPSIAPVLLLGALALAEHGSVLKYFKEAIPRWRRLRLTDAARSEEYKAQLAVTKDLLINAIRHGKARPLAMTTAAESVVCLGGYMPTDYGTACYEAMKAWAEIARLHGLWLTAENEIKSHRQEFHAGLEVLDEDAAKERFDKEVDSRSFQALCTQCTRHHQAYLHACIIPPKLEAKAWEEWHAALFDLPKDKST